MNFTNKNFARLFSIDSEEDFDRLALETFHYQFENNEVYNRYCSLLVKNNVLHDITSIPFLPISFFKTHKITTKPEAHPIVFTSSGTSGDNFSSHLVFDENLYKESLLKGFEKNYGKIKDFCVLALLPSYLERKGSSLIYMVNELIKKSECMDSGFFLYNLQELSELLKKYNNTQQKVLLLGVSYALMDFSEKYPFQLSENIIVMETGGMKGRRAEITRNELHQVLCEKFGKNEIHSEYGMTELLSQAYSNGNGIFTCPPWMRVIIRDPYDPFTIIEDGKTGGINIIDLANRYSCSFIETQDLGRRNADGTFEVLGRMEDSPIRGCNLMVE